ncbi:hypothetical protein FE257_000832 [Aspergillus nanangensis]|uniref:Ubiquitin carboxyl-terminal hydrolase 19 n=1 Tax=Aspergillus nanangensis TaxID=2582783 RepID=A0AAD4CEK0_ASPNN|nr:hypothetical protein FE257_000832 [Aspergillus nanangensis]
MDAQYPFASRDDIWRVFEDLKGLHAAQSEQSERIARLERRRDEDARLRSVWGPLSPFPTSVGGPMPTEPAFHSPADAFKGFDQGQHHSVGTMGLEGEEEPRRGTSRANSVRFDESAIHGHYGQTNRSSTELPLRTGSGMGSHPLSERSLSHRSDGRQSSSGYSHHSARTNSLGLETSSKMTGSSGVGSPLIPPPGLFLLGPVPCIIRCWLTTNFSNDSLLYAAICSGSYTSFLGYPMIRKYGLEDLVTEADDMHFIKLPMYLPEASVHQASSRPNSPMPQLPNLTIRFLVRDVDPNDPSIQIVIGSDVLRSHNADILFSQDKIIMVDDERNKISIPLVRPEDDSVFKSLRTSSDAAQAGRAETAPHQTGQPGTNGHASVGVIGPPSGSTVPSRSVSRSARGSLEGSEESRKVSIDTADQSRAVEPPPSQTKPIVSSEHHPTVSSTKELPGVWGSWKRDSKDSAANKPSRGRPMKVLRSTKSSSRTPTTATFANAGNPEPPLASSQPLSSQVPPDENTPRPGQSWTSNPIGGASAFGWLNPPPSSRASNPK